jgi:hypothetical protein
MDNVDQGDIIIIVEDESSPVSFGIDEFLELFWVGKLPVLGNCCFNDTKMDVEEIVSCQVNGSMLSKDFLYNIEAKLNDMMEPSSWTAKKTEKMRRKRQ